MCLTACLLLVGIAGCEEEPAGNAAYCSDGVLDGDETGVDCGGSCDPCGNLNPCISDVDCQSGNCDNQVCRPLGESCSDGTQNGPETDVDCGGGVCDACGDGSACGDVSDCESGVCTADVCQAATCTDGVANGMETDVDCGGGECPLCAEGQECQVATDCVTDDCESGMCGDASCFDAIANGLETDVDCGGRSCGPCPDGSRCGDTSDCVSLVCVGSAGETRCASPTCEDEVSNGDETGVDCGGECPDACPDGEGCIGDEDCLSEVCIDDTCRQPECDDEALNGTETDVDCGGDACPGCADELDCLENDDCLSLVCDSDVCLEATCEDETHNGSETDVDCGGPDCGGCAPGRACTETADCVGSAFCRDDICHSAVSCQELLDERPATTDGAHELDPDGLAGDDPVLVYCDMTTADGGWTLVASAAGEALDDRAWSYYEDLATLEPSDADGDVWNGLRGLITANSDIRFSCKLAASDPFFEVDLVFYDVDWYREITSGPDGASCFNTADADPVPAPARRRDLIADVTLPATDGWNAFAPGTRGHIGEDSCADADDFTIDFDDRGMAGEPHDGTDWGEADAEAKCGWVTPSDGAWFIWVRELP